MRRRGIHRGVDTLSAVAPFDSDASDHWGWWGSPMGSALGVFSVLGCTKTRVSDYAHD
jgi:hypothetical protein